MEPKFRTHKEAYKAGFEYARRWRWTAFYVVDKGDYFTYGLVLESDLPYVARRLFFV